jgi:adenosylcobinamide-GDP ribazoletransferase
MLRPLLIALQFLTRIPIRLRSAPTAVESGRSLLWYPAIGLWLGSLLWVLQIALSRAAPPLQAALLLSAWVLITGALHLDGLADSADAWLGGGGERERMLTIMKDPHVGAGAVVAIVVVLLLKFAAICSLVAVDRRPVLLLAPFLGRCAIPALFATTPYVRSAGIASTLIERLPKAAAAAVAIVGLAVAVLCFGAAGLWAGIATTLIFLLLRAAFVRHLGGTTGDTAGAMIELVELGVLIVLAVQTDAAHQL